MKLSSRASWLSSVHAVTHTVPALGFIVWERRNKLKEEYQSLSGEQIRDLRLAGTEVTHEIRMPLRGVPWRQFDRRPRSQPRRLQGGNPHHGDDVRRQAHAAEEIHKHGHMHLDEIVERRDRFENQVIIAGHFSTRYNGSGLEQLVTQSLPDMLGGRLQLWI